jgi:hypothetical protein
LRPTAMIYIYLCISKSYTHPLTMENKIPLSTLE